MQALKSSESVSPVVELVPKNLLIGEEWRDASSARTFAVENPATGGQLALVADGDANDGLAAIAAASEAQHSLAAAPPRERSEILRRTFEAVIEKREELALLITLEMGKPVVEVRAEVTYAAEFLRWFSEEAVRVNRRFVTEPSGNMGRMLVTKFPVGPCLLITPWNFPLAMGTRKVGAAIAAGYTVVLKPAHQTPLSSLAFAEILLDIGLPFGVLNVVTTSSASSVVKPLMRDDRLRKVSFTGSTEVGRELIRESADQLLRVSMELGGNAPIIVFGDADLDVAVSGAMVAKMRNGGESCTAANRFYVNCFLSADFAEQFAARMSSLVVGDGTKDGVEVGPLIDDRQRRHVDLLVTDAVELGAEIVTGGKRVLGNGYFFQPTVLTNVSRSSRALNEEIFGPVAPIVALDSDEEVIDAANSTPYGLVAFIFTRDLGRALRTMERLETGMVGINRGVVSNPAAPFGSVKNSGVGREGGDEGINEYLEIKYAALSL
jgi:succinate-semialdehyde dehydrogenase/glutarate-semialdehyde dehydrogenase